MPPRSHKIAQDKGNPDEKKFAEQMITDHTKTSTDLKNMMASGDVKADIPTSLDKSAQDKLRDARASDFGGDYDPMQALTRTRRRCSSIMQIRRQRQAQGLGRQDACAPASSGDDRKSRQEARLAQYH
jgi:predicted outer membrane protein